MYASFSNIDSMGGDGYQETSHVYISQVIIRGQHNYYCQYLEDCSYCLGCVGLKNMSYCIFNKHYAKEERYAKVDEIFTHMEKDGTLWSFFPWSMNLFYFNDTAAYLIDPSFTKQEVTKLWYLRRDEAIKVDIPTGAEVVKVSELWQYEWFSSGKLDPSGQVDKQIPPLSRGEPTSSGQIVQDDEVWSINPDILKKIIVDEQGNYYRIVQMEYDFLVKHWLPLPRKHRLDRMKENLRIL
jgi:hypothetical protein